MKRFYCLMPQSCSAIYCYNYYIWLIGFIDRFRWNHFNCFRVFFQCTQFINPQIESNSPEDHKRKLNKFIIMFYFHLTQFVTKVHTFLSHCFRNARKLFPFCDGNGSTLPWPAWTLDWVRYLVPLAPLDTARARLPVRPPHSSLVISVAQSGAGCTLPPCRLRKENLAVSASLVPKPKKKNRTL